MGRTLKEPLTEPMYYTLLAFHHRGDLCGAELTAWVSASTHGRVCMGPGTLYTILAGFERALLIRQVAVEGRKRTYRLTGQGEAVFQAELKRLRLCVADGERKE